MVPLPFVTTQLASVGALLLAFVTGAAVGSSDPGSAVGPLVSASSGHAMKPAQDVYPRRFPKRGNAGVRYITDKNEIIRLATVGFVGKDDPDQALVFDPKFGRLAFNDGCNSGSMGIDSIDNQGLVHTSDAITTDVYCGPEIGQKAELFSLLEMHSPIVIAELLRRPDHGASGAQHGHEQRTYLIGNGYDGLVFVPRTGSHR